MLSNLHFLSDTTFYDAEKPYQVFVQLPPGAKTSNCQTTNHSVDLLDVRGNENEFTLDHQGFKFVKHPSTAARNLACSPQIGNQDIVKYLDEVIALLKHEFNTKHIVCFDWRIRKEGSSLASIDPSTFADNRRQPIPVASSAHCDYSHDGGLARIRRQLARDEFEQYSQESWQIRIVNVWRPLVASIERAPLALCDCSSVMRDDLVPVDKVHHDHWEEGYLLRYRESQRWYWWSRQTMDEASIFVTWSADDTTSSCAPHASFTNPEASLGAPLRASIEVRSIVFTKG